MKLHLGCGDNYLEGWVNADHEAKADVDIDLEQYPYPWADGSADEILMEHVLEHLSQPELCIKEVHRLLKSGGRVIIAVPHRVSVAACGITHRSFFTHTFFRGFSAARPNYWAVRHGCVFTSVEYRVRILKHPRLKWTPFDALASRYPCFWEKCAPNFLMPTEIIWTATK